MAITISDTLKDYKTSKCQAKQRASIKPIPRTKLPVAKRKPLNTRDPHIRDFSKCPRCGAPLEISMTYAKEPSKFWRECPKCNTYVNTYIPQEHQQAFHTDSHRFKGNFGGYGSGKTQTTLEEFYKHMFLTTKGTGLIGANISAQYEQTIKRELEADFPVNLIKDVSIQKSYMEFINGYRLMYRPFDDPGKLRSLNLDFIAIIEGSEVDPQLFIIAKTRLRNLAATKQLYIDGVPQYTLSKEGVPIPVIDTDWRQTIVESNPDAGWIKSEIVLKASDIRYNGPTIDSYKPNPEEEDPAISVHITDTSCNAYLPPTYMTDVAKGRPDWWVNRYLHGSFTYSEGLVYPSAITNLSTKAVHIIPAVPIPKDWKRMFAFDYGLSDAAAMIWAAIDERENKLIVYKEYKETNRNVEQLANTIKEGCKDVPQGGWVRPYLIDPKSGVKRDYNKKSLADHFLEYGIAFQPGQVSVNARVYKLNTMFELDRIEIMDNCTALIKELTEYKFPSDLNKDSGRGDKPEDRNNHAINALEWIVMEIPTNPADILYGTFYTDGVISKQKSLDAHEYTKQLFDIDNSTPMRVPHPLQDAEQDTDLFIPMPKRFGNQATVVAPNNTDFGNLFTGGHNSCF